MLGNRTILYWAVLLFLPFIVGQVHAQQGSDTMPSVHDPVMIQQGNRYYLFSTGWGIDVFSSTDKKHWKKEKPVFGNAPGWAIALIPGFKGHIWAPDIAYHNGLYYLFYAVSAFGKNTSAIGVATNTTLDPNATNYKWVDHGKVIQSVPGRDNWNAIDPNIVWDEKGRPWLSFGSFWGGIKLVALDSSLCNVAVPEQWYTLASRQQKNRVSDSASGDDAIEAPFIFKKNDYFYLFASYDYCCRAEKSTYHVKVGQSRNVYGPFLDKNGVDMRKDGGTELIGGDARFYAAGHNGIAILDDGDYFVCHGYDRLDKGKSKLVIKKIVWDKGWPELLDVH